MTDSTLNRFVSSGTAAERAAFTPDPPTPASGPDPAYIWIENDTGDVYMWDPVNASWTQVNVGGLASIADDRVLANISGGAAAPVANTLTAIIDACIGSTQGNILYRNNTAWVVLAPGTAGHVLQTGGAAANPSWTAQTGGSSAYPAFTTPVDGDYGWINQGGASVTVNANGGIYLLGPANSGDSLRIRKKSVTAPYTITAAFLAVSPGIATRLAGLLWRQSSDGKLISWGPAWSDALGAYQFECNDWNSATSFSATNASLDIILGAGLFWLRLVDNNTNRIVSWSLDGYNFIDVFTETRTTFLTADEVGFFVNTNTTAGPAAATLLSWAQT